MVAEKLGICSQAKNWAFLTKNSALGPFRNMET